MKTHDEAYSTPGRIQTNPNKTKRKLRQTENRKFEAKPGFFGFVFLFMGLQPLKPCLITLTTNEWSRCSVRSPVPGSLTLTASTKHLYHACHRFFRRLCCLPHIIPTFTLFPIGRSPTRPGGGGATPTLKTHEASGVIKFCVQLPAKHVLRYIDIAPIAIPKFRVTDST